MFISGVLASGGFWQRLITSEDEVLSVLCAAAGASRPEEVVPSASLALRYVSCVHLRLLWQSELDCVHVTLRT